MVEDPPPCTPGIDEVSPPTVLGVAVSYLEHLPDLIRVHVQVLAWVDGDHGRPGVGLYEVVDISLPQSVKDRALVEISKQCRGQSLPCLSYQTPVFLPQLGQILHAVK